MDWTDYLISRPECKKIIETDKITNNFIQDSATSIKADFRIYYEIQPTNHVIYSLKYETCSASDSSHCQSSTDKTGWLTAMKVPTGLLLLGKDNVLFVLMERKRER